MLDFLTLFGVLSFGLEVWLFWLFAVVFVGLQIALTENEHWGWSSVAIVVSFLGLGFLNIFNLFHFAVDHTVSLIWDVGIYLIAGIFWGAIKWWRYCVNERYVYDEAREDFLASHCVSEFTPELRVEWTNKLKSNYRYGRFKYTGAPLASEHQEKIINWMYLWPFSVMGTICSDFIRKIWSSFYEWMGGVYTSIARSVWKGTEDDLASEQDFARAVLAPHLKKRAEEN